MMDISARELKGHDILAVERFWAVSYTHLDVYKRQMYAPCKTDGTCCDISQTSKLSAVKIDIVECGRDSPAGPPPAYG